MCRMFSRLVPPLPCGSVISTYQMSSSRNRERRIDPQDFSLDSEMGRRPISRCLLGACVLLSYCLSSPVQCLFATRGSIQEVHHLTHPILASEKGPNTICRCCLWENDPHTCGTGGRRLQANELAAAIQDEVAPGESGCMTPHAADPRAEHAKGLLGRLVVAAIHGGYRTIVRNERTNAVESSRCRAREPCPRACPPLARTTKKQT